MTVRSNQSLKATANAPVPAPMSTRVMPGEGRRCRRTASRHSRSPSRGTSRTALKASAGRSSERIRAKALGRRRLLGLLLGVLADEVLGRVARLLVLHLLGRRLHQVGAGAAERPRDAVVERELR